MLRHWLFCEEATYRECCSRLRDQFGLVVSISTVFKFLRACRRAPLTDERRLTFDGTLQSDSPIRLQVFNGKARLYLTRMAARRRTTKTERIGFGHARKKLLNKT